MKLFRFLLLCFIVSCFYQTNALQALSKKEANQLEVELTRELDSEKKVRKLILLADFHQKQKQYKKELIYRGNAEELLGEEQPDSNLRKNNLFLTAVASMNSRSWKKSIEYFYKLENIVRDGSIWHEKSVEMQVEIAKTTKNSKLLEKALFKWIQYDKRHSDKKKIELYDLLIDTAEKNNSPQLFAYFQGLYNNIQNSPNVRLKKLLLMKWVHLSVKKNNQNEFPFRELIRLLDQEKNRIAQRDVRLLFSEHTEKNQTKIEQLEWLYRDSVAAGKTMPSVLMEELLIFAITEKYQNLIENIMKNLNKTLPETKQREIVLVKSVMLAHQKDYPLLEISFRKGLVKILSGRKGKKEQAFSNLYRLGVLQSRNEQYEGAEKSFGLALSYPDIKDTERRNLLLQHLYRLHLKQADYFKAEKFLANYVLATAKSSSFDESSGGFRQLIVTAKRNKSEKIHTYFQTWYDVALETAPKEEIPNILTQWINYIVDTPNQYNAVPFDQLAGIYRESKKLKDLSQVLTLKAQQLGEKPEANQVYAEVYKINLDSGEKTSLGVLTRLYDFYKSTNQPLKKHQILLALAAREDYPFKDNALKEAANLSVTIEDWLTALETHRRLLEKTGSEKPDEKISLLRNLITITQKLTRDEEFFKYIEDAIGIQTKTISLNEKYNFFSNYEEKRMSNREFKAGLGFYSSLVAKNIFQQSDYQYKVHLYGGRLAELSQDVPRAIELYNQAILSIPASSKGKDRMVIAIKNKIFQILRNSRSLAETIPLLNEILQLQRKDIKEAELANTTLLLAQAYDEATQPDHAFAYYKNALSLYQKAGNKVREKELLTLLANRDSGTFESREKRLLELEKAQRDSGDISSMLVTGVELGNLYQQFKKPELALIQYRKVSSSEQQGAELPRMKASYQLAWIENSKGKVAEALKQLNQVEAIYQRLKKSGGLNDEYVEILLDSELFKTRLLIDTGDFKSAESTLKKLDKIKNKAFQFRIVKAFADLWYQQSFHSKSIKFLKKNIKSFGLIEKAEVYFLIARAEYGRGANKASIASLKKSEELLKGGDAEPLILEILDYRSRNQMAQGNIDEAIETQKKIAELAEQQKQPLRFQGAVLQLAEYYLQSGRIAEALKESDRFKPFLKKSSLNRNLKYWLIAAEINQKQNKFDASLRYFNQIKENTKKMDHSNPFFGKYFYLFGISHLQLLNFEEAFKGFQQSELVYKKNGNKVMSLQSRLAQANTRLQQGKLNQAENILIKLDQDAKGNVALKADIQNGFALLYSEAGQYDKALKFSSKAEKSYQKAELKAQIPEVLNTRALIYLKLKDFRQAEIIFNDALSQNKPQNNPLLDAQILNNLGGLYQSTGNLRKARQQLIKTAELQKELGFESELALTYNNIGSVYLSQKKYKESLSFLKQARQYAEKFGLRKELAQSWNNEGIVYFRQKLFSKAEDAFENAKLLQEELSLQLDLSRTLNNLSMIASNEKNTEKALVMIQGAIQALSLNPLDKNAFYPNPELNAILAPDLMKNFLQNKGSFLKKLASGDDEKRFQFLEAAYNSFAGSIELVESLRNQIKSEESQQLLFAENIDVFQQLISILYDLGVKYPEKDYHQKAFLYSEMSRARTFLDQLQEQAARTSFKLPDDMAAKENRLKRRLTTLDQNIFEELSKRAKKRDKKKVEDWQLEKSQVQLEFKALTEEMEKKFPAYASLKYPKVYGVPEITKTSKIENSTTIAYMVGEDRSFGWSIGENHFRMVALAPNADIDRLIRKYRKTLVNPLVYPDEEDEDVVIDNSKTHMAIGLQIYRTIIDPLLRDTSKAKKLVVIPDGVIYYLPLETVVSSIKAKASKQMPEGREYMLHRYSLVYTPSASVQGAISMQQKARSQSKLKNREDFLGFGDPQFKPSRKQRKTFKKDPTFKRQGFYDLSRLFNTINELKKISKLFKGTQKTFLRKKALESNVKKNISNFKYIHFATHGILDEKNPEYSGVVMNIIEKDKKEDGFLQASEIFDLNLNADMVTLSACETGLGKVIKGEGMVGLTRAFLFAGTPSIVVSLWTVADESTSNLMIHFYNYLKKGLNKDEALQKAKLKLMSQTNDRTGAGMADPFYWGPFVLNGTR